MHLSVQICAALSAKEIGWGLEASFLSLWNEAAVPASKRVENTVSLQDRKKRTVNFDEGQKFTSDEDIIKRRTA